MVDAFLFKAQPEINKIEKPPDPRTSSKRAQSFDVDVGAESIRPPVMESFKSKLLNTSNPVCSKEFCKDNTVDSNETTQGAETEPTNCGTESVNFGSWM
ncbi:hypothetical protein QYF36_019627 [Acer negundo]|nr:hypothetical protein QYF36_019627 [Acer negundo]